MRKTKVVCTIGPSSCDVSMLESLILNGMDVARINTSHSSKEDARSIINDIRKLSLKYGKNTAIMLDLQGPKIRTGDLEGDINIADGKDIIFTTADFASMDKYLPVVKVEYEKFLDDIKEGFTIFIDDGLLEFKINEIDKTKKIAKASAVRGGIIKSKKGINIPGVLVSVNSVTEKDLDFLSFGIEQDVDFIAQSFIRNTEDVIKIKEIIKTSKSHIMVIAKIEKHEAVNDFNRILKHADAIMVARGDLGIEMPQEDVPNIQKNIIKRANIAGKPVITATQMLDSMIRNFRPTRAEVSDVANAIHDGSDALMLSGETAAGMFPLQSLQMMVRIISKTESVLDYREILQKKFSLKKNSITESISFAACEIASVMDASAIISATQSGSTARQISKNRPANMIIGASPHDWVIRQLMISWGVIPVKTVLTKDIESMISAALDSSLKLKLVKKGEMVVVTGGVMVNKPGSTNFINVNEVM
ncbi:MAG: pyruvate kinase [Actinobacteria bacterium]|nr:pyruvate kinase [Actinomycetota bacterium]